MPWRSSWKRRRQGVASPFRNRSLMPIPISPPAILHRSKAPARAPATRRERLARSSLRHGAKIRSRSYDARGYFRRHSGKLGGALCASPCSSSPARKSSSTRWRNEPRRGEAGARRIGRFPGADHAPAGRPRARDAGDRRDRRGDEARSAHHQLPRRAGEEPPPRPARQRHPRVQHARRPPSRRDQCRGHLRPPARRRPGGRDQARISAPAWAATSPST